MGTMSNRFIALRDVYRGFSEGGVSRPVLAGLNLTLAEGERVALLGRSGSGKSTLLNIISGIDLPDSGEVFVAEQDLTRLSEHERTLFRRRHIGFIYQFFNLIPTLTVEENLLLPLDLNGVTGGKLQELAYSLLAEIGLGDRRNSFPDRLSGGEQQRLAIARALVKDPPIYMFDDSFAALDFRTEAALRSALEERTTASTVLIVTQRVSTIKNADQIIVLDGGRVVGRGTHQQLMDSCDTYREIALSQLSLEEVA